MEKQIKIIKISGIGGEHCVNKVTEALSPIKGVIEISVPLEKKIWLKNY